MTRRRWIYSLAAVLSLALPLGVSHSAPDEGATVFKFRSSSAYAQVQADGLRLFFDETEVYNFITGETFIAGFLQVEIMDFETGFFGFGFALLLDRESYIATDSLVFIPGEVEVLFPEFDPTTGELLFKTAILSDLVVEGDGPVTVRTEAWAPSDPPDQLTSNVSTVRSREAVASGHLLGIDLDVDLNVDLSEIDHEAETGFYRNVVNSVIVPADN